MINLLEENPVNIAGVVFVAQPENVDDVATTLKTFPGAEVHACDEKGNLVVTIEDQPNQENSGVAGDKPQRLIDTITTMSNVPGVISSSLIFHHNDAGLPQHQEKKV